MRTWSVFIIAFVFSACLSGQGLSSNVSSDSILLGNHFIYEIKLENIDEKIDFPNLGDFQIISGPATSSSISIVNGVRSSSQRFTWHLKPIDLGQYYIEPIALKIKDEIYETEPVEINVYPNPEGIITNPKQMDESDFFNFPSPQQFPNTPPIPQKEKLKSKRELKKG